MKVLLDLDGVLVDFVGGAAKHHGFDPKLANCWDFMPNTGISPADFWAPLGKRFWSNLDWTPEGPAILKVVEAAVGAANVCVLTSPCDTEGCAEGKLRWIRDNMPDYRRRYFLGTAKEFVASHKLTLVDDHDKNVDQFLKAGGGGVLVPRPWNRLRGHVGCVADYVAKSLRLLL